MGDPAPPLARPDYRAEIRRNQWHALVLLTALAGVIVVLAGAVVLLAGAGLVGLLAVVVVAALAAAGAYLGATTAALAGAHARPAEESAFARYHNLVEGLCIAAGLAKPSLYVVDDPALNALAAGRSPRRAALVVTTGMLGSLNRVELEGVLAHELSHVKNDDVLPATVAVTAAGALAPIGPLAAALVQLAAGARREARADESSVQITRYPPGLSAALRKVDADPAVVRHTRRAMDQLWLASPRADGGHGTWLERAYDTHPPLADRIRSLESM